MQKLKTKIIENETKDLNEKIKLFLEQLMENENELTNIEKYCLYRSTPYKKNRKETVIKRLKEKTQKEVDNLLSHVDRINSAENSFNNSLVITINFYKNRTWGYCPVGSDNYGKKTGSITGYGYDKESTASAEILNQHNIISKRMYQIKNDNIDTKNSDLFGYGSGYSFLPSFEGGVGIDCHIRILEKIGFKVQKTGNNTTTILIIE